MVNKKDIASTETAESAVGETKKSLSLRAKVREVFGKRTKAQRREGLLPSVLYGPKTKNLPLTLNFKEFEKVWLKAGESSLINLEIEGKKKELPVLIHDIQKDPISDRIIHVDLYQPDLEKKVTALVPLVIIGVAPSVKKLGGTLIRNFTEIEVRALPIDLPHDIKVNVENLEKIHDEILIRDLSIPRAVEVLRSPAEVVLSVTPPSRVEEELEKPEEEAKEPELVKEEEEKAREEEEGRPAGEAAGKREEGEGSQK